MIQLDFKKCIENNKPLYKKIKVVFYIKHICVNLKY